MKKLAFLLTLISSVAFAAPVGGLDPCYWFGQLVKCFPTTGIYLDNQKQIRFGELTTNGVNYVAVTAPAALASNPTLTLPEATDTLVGKATTDTFTNKTISGASNTLTVRAASDITGQLPTANGGTAQNSTATFPASGVVVTEAASETLTNKTISGASNTLTVRAASDITGQLPTANGGTAQNSTATFPTSGVVVTEAATETLSNKTLQFPTTGGTPASLDFYETGTFTASFSVGMRTGTNNVTMTFVRLGGIVVLSFPQTLVTANATSGSWATASGILAARLRPTTNQVSATTFVVNNGTQDSVAGEMEIKADGTIAFDRNAGNWTNTTTQCGFQANHIAYSVQ